MNTPYVKEYDKNGVLKNPIKSAYWSNFENRQQRRKKLQKQRFHGNGKNTPLTVVQTARFLRYRQIIEGKEIEHYLPRTKSNAKPS